MSLKEKLRGVVATIATAAIALSVAPVTALAAAQPLSAGTATVNGVAGAENVELYKVASVTNNENNVLKFTLEQGYDFSIDEYRNAKNDSERAVIANTVAGQVTGEATYSVENGAGEISGDTATFKNVDAGLYFVKVSPEEAGKSYQSMIIAVVPQAQLDGTWGVPSGTVNLKFTDDKVSTSLAKHVSDTDLGLDGQWTETSIDTLDGGDTAYFQVEVQLPTYHGLTADSGIHFDLVDQLPVDGGLSYVQGSAMAKFGENTVSEDAINWDDSHKTITVSLDAEDLMNVTSGDKLVLTLAATVETGQLGKLENSAYVNWFKHVTDGDMTKTGSVTASVIVYGANVTKVEGALNENGAVVGNSEDEALQGAVFKLEKQNTSGGWDVVKEEVAANDGESYATTPTQLSLGAGKYKWTEVQAPAGYQLNSTPLVFEISSDNVSNYISSQYFGDLKDESSLSFLPSTGESGTIALTVAGAGLVIAAATAVARTRKEH